MSWEGWEAIDAAETGLARPRGRRRVKLVRLHELLNASKAARARR